MKLNYLNNNKVTNHIKIKSDISGRNYFTIGGLVLTFCINLLFN